jgi:hypothetical protein
MSGSGFVFKKLMAANADDDADGLTTMPRSAADTP